jgi:hypothetical protein
MEIIIILIVILIVFYFSTTTNKKKENFDSCDVRVQAGMCDTYPDWMREKNCEKPCAEWRLQKQKKQLTNDFCSIFADPKLCEFPSIKKNCPDQCGSE